MSPGDIYRHSRFYLDVTTGEMKSKFLLALAISPAGDFIVRLLTSRTHGRPEKPPCFHGAPYAGFYLGVLGGPLSAKSWLDLRQQDDLDADEFNRAIRKGFVSKVTELPRAILIPALDCAARADDTTRHQGKLMRDVLATLS